MKLIGRDKELGVIEDYVTIFQSGLSPEGAPVGSFLMAGPSGCGKTRTVEYLAHKLHGSHKNVMRIDCGEFQLEHEVARLIGAPPGYLGHRETTPLLTQQRLNAVTSDKSNLSLVLFDEIEKAAQSMQKLLLGIMDKAMLRLGDNTVVNFERTMIFFTSNLGTRDLFKENAYEIVPHSRNGVSDLGILGAIKKYFAPEFMNRLNDIFVYHPLTEDQIRDVVRSEMDAFVASAMNRFRGLTVIYDASLCDALFERGYSREYGGRQLKRTIHTNVIVPLARWARENPLTGASIALSWDNALVIDKLPGTVSAGARVKKARD